MTENKQAEPEQGFFPQRATVSLTQKYQPPQQQQRPLHYQARVLINYPSAFKFPREVYQRYLSIPTIEEEIAGRGCWRNEKAPNLKKQQKSAFQLVYDKFNRSSSKHQAAEQTNRNINLDYLLKYRESDYFLLEERSADSLLEQKAGEHQFVSSFQCGNLHKVYKDRQESNHYICFIQNDTNTNGYNQFFYFGLKGVKKKLTYRFSIVNFTKRQSFFRTGMKPILFSLRKHQTARSGWYRKAYNISYSKTTHPLLQHQQQLYTLYFQTDFQHDNDFVTISSAIPYSYSRLIYRLKQLKRAALERDLNFQLQTVAYTLSNNQVPEVVISKPIAGQNQESMVNLAEQGKKAGNSTQFKKLKRKSERLGQSKKTIVILARQHPGQTNSSLLMQEILQKLFEEHNPKIRWLLQHFQFRIYPMVNVDGVIYGNSRCDLAGFDLNRTWRHPIKEIHPQIYAIKKRLKQIANSIVYCIDLHSHSKMYNVFNYGCTSDQITSRLFSWLISKNTPLFHFPSCAFGLSFDKRHTLRAFLAYICSPQIVATIETSYYGVKTGNKVESFQPKMLQQIGYAILLALGSYLKKDVNSKKCLKQLKERQQGLANEENKEDNHDNSDSEVQKDVNPLDCKLRQFISNEKFIQMLKKKYEQEQRQMEDEERRYRQRLLSKHEKQEQKTSSPQPQNNTHQSPPKEQAITLSHSNRQKLLNFQDRPKIMERIKQNKQAYISKYNVDAQCTNLPPLNQHRNAWNKSKKFRRPSKLYIRNENGQQKCISNEPEPNTFDDKQFQKEMKFLYRQLRNGLRDDYLKRQRNKDRSKCEKGYLAKGKRFQSLNNLCQAARNSLNKSKVANIKSLLPNAFKVQDKVLLRIKSEHYQELHEKEDLGRWRYNLNNSEMVNRSSENQFCDAKFENREKLHSCLPIFSKFFKVRQESSFKK